MADFMLFQIDTTEDFSVFMSDVTVLLILFQIEDTVLWIAFITEVIVPFMLFQALDTAVRMAFRTLVMVVLIAVQICWKKSRMPSRIGVRKATMPFQISCIFALIASSAMPMRICMACQMVSNRYWSAESSGSKNS